MKLDVPDRITEVVRSNAYTLMLVIWALPTFLLKITLTHCVDTLNLLSICVPRRDVARADWCDNKNWTH